MATAVKSCPKCVAEMRMYTVAQGESSWHWSQHLLWQGIGLLVFMVVAVPLTSLGDNGLITGLIVVPLITGGIAWKFSRGDQQRAIAEHARYYCKACSQHFEGDKLRQISE